MRFLTLIVFATLVSSHCHGQLPQEKIAQLFSKSAEAFDGAKQQGAFLQIEQEGSVLVSHSLKGFDMHTQVPIASASKWLSALVLLRLVDQGKIQLNDQVSKYLPAFQKPDRKTMTIAQCFSHTSGLPGLGEDNDEGWKRSQGSLWAQTSQMAELPLQGPPGSTFSYGGMSMQVAAAACEVATGKSWNQLFTQEVLLPLGMEDTYFIGHRVGRLPRVGGGIMSTASDYLKVLRMFANGGRANGKIYLSKKALDQFFANQSGQAAVAHSPFTKYQKTDAQLTTPGYAVGHWVLRINQQTIHASPGAFGFTPWFNPATGQIGVLATQSAGPKVMPVWLQMMRLF